MSDEQIKEKLIPVLRRCYDDSRNVETRFYYCRYEIERLIQEIEESKK